MVIEHTQTIQTFPHDQGGYNFILLLTLFGPLESFTRYVKLGKEKLMFLSCVILLQNSYYE